MRDLKEQFDWRRVAIAAASISILSIGALAAAAVPVVRKLLVERKVQRIDAIYATGLRSCKYNPGGMDALLQKYLPSRPSVSITAQPSFTPPVAIRLVGDDLYYFILDFPLYVTTGEPPYKLNTKGIPIIYHVRVSNEIARDLSAVIADNIKHAHLYNPRRGMVFDDGTEYTFQASSTSCGWTDSAARTRAARLIDLFGQLSKRAESSDVSDAAASEREILATLKTLLPN